jgi:tetratricopeptide (TPR) repeat protein
VYELLNYVSDPSNANAAFALGLYFEDKGHVAAASVLYLRTAEFTSDDLLAYEALLRTANCYTRAGDRTTTTKGVLLRAISLMPERPEAYFLLSRLYEMCSDWHEAYTFAVMGQRLNHDHPRLRTNVDYPGAYGLVYEQAISAWWIGLFDESIHLLRQLKKNTAMLPIHIASVDDNLRRLEPTIWHTSLSYERSMYERLRVKFPGSRFIERNYSQVYQDMFVLTMLNGKRDGTFVEIGCRDPEFNSNTKLLEEWGWTGTSIDILPEATAQWEGRRKARVITANALMIDYDALLSQRDYDYLQIDIEPALQSLTVLLKIPFEKHRFGVITFEHEDFRGLKDNVKERSRSYLRSQGYVLVAADIAPDDYENFEDWWIHPDLVDPKIVSSMQNTSDAAKRADRYMLTS